MGDVRNRWAGERNQWRRLRRLPMDLLRLSDDIYRLRLTAGEAAIRASRTRYDTACGLADVEARVFSQWGEDGILDFLLERLEVPRPRCLEIGVGDYREANTRLLVELRGAQAVVVDASPRLAARVKGDDIAWRGTVVPVQMFVTPSNIRRPLREVYEFGGAPDLVSMDVDGMDYWLLEAMPLDECSVVVAEYNALLGCNRPVTVPYAENFSRHLAHYSGIYYGASLPALVHLMTSRGFCFVGTTESKVNAFFVRKDLTELLPFALPDSSDLAPYARRSVRDSRGRDGRLVFANQAEQLRQIAGLPVVDVVTGETVTLPV